MSHCTLHEVDTHSRWLRVLQCYKEDFPRFKHTMKQYGACEIDAPEHYRGYLHIVLEAGNCTFEDIYRRMYDIHIPHIHGNVEGDDVLAVDTSDAINATLYKVNDAIDSLLLNVD